MSISKSFSFSPTTIARSAEVNQNFDDLVTAIRAAHHADSDGTQIVDADVNASSAIQESKILFSATGHRHEGTTDGRNVRAEGLASDTDSFAEVTGGKGAMTAAGIHTFNATSRARAYLNGGNQAITSGVVTLITLDAESYDTRSEFDDAVNYRFTATVAGYYIVCAQIYWAVTVADKTYYTYIYKNGAIHNIARSHSSVAENLNSFTSDVIELAATDYVDLRGNHNAGVNQSAQAASHRTFLSVHKVG